MWGSSQGWNQWALQPAMFNDVPHEQIDWAELAKQWIQMQQTQPSDAVPPPPPQGLPPISLPPPPGHGPLLPEEITERSNPPLLKTPTVSHVPDIFHPERQFESEAETYMSKVGEPNFWNKPQWEPPPSDINERLWNAPPIEPAAPLLGGKETFDYGHVHDNPPLAMQTIDYNHMSDYSYNQIYTPPVPPPPIPENQYDQYWTQVNAAPTIAPIFLKKERVTSNMQVEEETPQIDAAKRKQLPAWIRDGLEKMEQERLKRLEKERNAKEQEEKLSKAELLKNELTSNSSAVTFVPKSKFESDSDGEQSEEAPIKRNSPIAKRIPSPIEDTRTEEEKKQDIVLKVRRTLTEVLLSVTNSEMLAIAQEVYKKAKSRAPARQLASSTSLTSVASGLRGLASYDSGSEASEIDERRDSSDSEEELHRKIKEKKKLFAVKERKIIAEIERKELEDKSEKEKMNNGNSEIAKDDKHLEEVEITRKDSNFKDKTLSVIPFPKPNNSDSIPFITEISEPVDNQQVNNVDLKSVQNKSESNSSESSSSSDSDSDSTETNKKKSYKESKKEKSRSSRHEISPSKRDRHHKHAKNRDSDSSEKHKRGRSPDRSERRSSNKKRKKDRRSDSSSSSESTSHRKKSSSKRASNHNHSRERRSRSYDERRYRGSKSPSKSYRKSDSHSHRSSHSHRYRDDKYDKKYRDEKRHRDSRRSPSPHSHSSKLPRKYRTSRSLSSDIETAGKKSKKSRNR